MQSHGEPGAEVGQDLTEVLNMLRATVLHVYMRCEGGSNQRNYR